jgi:hypothetical protein
MNCEYCQSKVFETDRNCPQCGAPNVSYQIEENQDTYSFSMFIHNLENQPQNSYFDRI